MWIDLSIAGAMPAQAVGLILVAVGFGIMWMGFSLMGGN